jgi:hypothetical protein
MILVLTLIPLSFGPHSVINCLLRSWSGLCIFCNPPFSLALRVMLHFLKCKIENSVGTAALFILPVWKEYDPIRLVLDMPRTFKHVITWKAKTMGMFTSKPSPQEGLANRKDCGPTRWPVAAYHVGPGLMTENIPSWCLSLM